MSPRGSERLAVAILDPDRRSPLSNAEIRRLLRGAAACVGAPHGEVAVLLTGDGPIRVLNRTFRGKDRPTDVLSFPDGSREPGRPARIGDIVVSIPAALRNAARARHALDREVATLLIHGLLHLVGFDHEVDGGEMASLEAEIRRRLIRTPGRARAGR